MIRINLLGLSNPKKHAAATLPSLRMPNMLAIAGLIAAVTLVGNYAWFWTLDREAIEIRTQVQEEEARNRRLADIKSRYLDLEKQKNEYEHRVNVINELVKQKKGPSELLTTIADTVNRTDAVWLNTMREEGEKINLEGVALSVNAVASLMQNLRSTGQFRSVEIKETFQDDVVKDVQAFTFTLICERQSSAQSQQPQPQQQKS